MLRRFAFNALAFAVVLGGLAGFLVARGAVAVGDAVVVVALCAGWAGVLVALIEEFVSPIAHLARRLALAAVAGAAAYVGLFLGVASLAGFPLRPPFLLLGAVLGAASHALRAKLYGGPRAPSDESEAGGTSDGGEDAGGT